MDVFTRPRSDTYQTGTIFTLPVNGTGYESIALNKATASAVLVLYAVLIQFLFALLWQITIEVLVGFLKADTRVRLVGIVALYNCQDPWSALFAMVSYVKGVFHKIRERSGIATYADFLRAVGFLSLAVSFCGVSLGISIRYPLWLELEGAAPVHPASVFLPDTGKLDGIQVLRLSSILRPAILRAMGSAEAADMNSKRSEFDYSYDTTSNHIDYRYDIDATDFGLQTHLGLTQRVRGSCDLNYTWLHASDPRSERDIYYLWGDENHALQQPGNAFPSGWKLAILSSIKFGETPGGREANFALFLSSTTVGSISASLDPWYATELVSELPTEVRDTYGDTPFRIKPGRPVLVCSQETVYELDGKEYVLADFVDNDDNKVLPEGITAILTFNFPTPQIARLVSFGGALALSAAVGSSISQLIDAEKASLNRDMERLVLAAYLSSKTAFRDAALMGREDTRGYPNFMLNPRKEVKEGGKDFFMRTDTVAAFRLDLLVTAPTLIVTFALIRWTAKVLKKNNKNRFSMRQNALSAPHLLRILDESHAPDQNVWEKEFSSVPMPLRSVANEHPVVPNRAARPTIVYRLVEGSQGRPLSETSGICLGHERQSSRDTSGRALSIQHLSRDGNGLDSSRQSLLSPHQHRDIEL
ncbi:Fc.00g000030.m01.CDS01 [Cosmosporella sp. VM-42]